MIYKNNILKTKNGKIEKIPLLNFNRHNYDVIQTYIKIKELAKTDCQNDPLFKPIPVLSIKRKLSTILNLPTGKTENADKNKIKPEPLPDSQNSRQY